MPTITVTKDILLCVKDCEFCAGTGEIEFDEQVYPGEAPMASTGITRCPNSYPSKDDEEYDDQED